MTRLLLELVVRSTLLAGGTALVLWALRVRSPALRHAAWATVVVVMLLLPASSLAGLGIRVPLLPRALVSLDSDSTSIPASAAHAARKGSEPQSDVAAATAATAGEPSPGALALAGVYLLGTLALLIRLVVGTVHACRLRRGAIVRAGRATSTRCVTPVTVGLFSPALILPEGWDRWPAARLDLVVTHEQAHARRHDPLVQWLALLNRAVFWFHPLAWWLERRLANLAEQVCDAAVIRAGHAPQEYSDCLLDMARVLSREGRRLNVAGMAMPGSDLAKRMRYIFEEAPMTPHSRALVFSMFVLCAASSIVCAAGILVPRPADVPGQQAATGAPPRARDVSLESRAAVEPPQEATRPVAPSPNAAGRPPAAAPAPSRTGQGETGRPDLSGHWSLASSTSAGGGRGGTGEAGVEREVRTKWVSGAPVNCGPECTITQDAKTLSISRLGTSDAVTLYDNGLVVLNLDDSESTVTQPRGTHYVVHAAWEGEKLVVTYHSAYFTVTQILSIQEDTLKVVTDFGVGDAPVTFTYVKG